MSTTIRSSGGSGHSSSCVSLATRASATDGATTAIVAPHLCATVAVVTVVGVLATALAEAQVLDG
jgi:hypothetical protein